MSVELKLTAGCKTGERILEYLRANASDVLAEKINAGNKSLAGALSYCKVQARKLAQDSGMVCVEDETVFGWVIHYFEEAELDQEEKPEEPKPKKEIQLPAGVKRSDHVLGKDPKPEKLASRQRKSRSSAAEAERQDVAFEKAQKPGQVVPDDEDLSSVPAKAEKPATPPDPQLSLFDALMGGGKA